MKMNASKQNTQNIIDIQDRLSQWEKKSNQLIHNISKDDNVLKKQFVVAQVSGVYFSNSKCRARYCSSEICFIKFNFQSGITDSLTLFPDALKVPTGYRESLYEDLDEVLGWRPDTFRNNQSIEYCLKQIKTFFNGSYDPIFALDEQLSEQLTMALYDLYSEVEQKCPWVDSIEDRGQHCSIYLLDRLTAEIMNKEKTDKLCIAEVRSYCNDMNMNISFDTCERHESHGMANQCAKAVATKNLYSQFLLMYTVYKDQMSNIQTLVSKDYFNSMDFILENKNEEKLVKKESYHNYWSKNSFEDTEIEDVVNQFGSISMDRRCNFKMTEDIPCQGRGRGLLKSKCDIKAPGVTVKSQKVRLPRVIC